jgi:hypothetical protein
VADEEHSPGPPAQRQVRKEPAHPGHGLAPALASRVRVIEMITAVREQLSGGGRVIDSVIAFA